MRDDQKFEIERAFDLLPHVVGASWTVTGFRFNGIKTPTKEEFRNKVIEYFEMLDPLFDAYVHDDKQWTLDHFYRKLLKLETIMNTKSGKIEAKRRTKILRNFLNDLKKEI